MSEHTPTPWFHRQGGMCGKMGEPYDWIADHPERGRHRKIIVTRDACDPADYAFIVKAANSFDDMLEYVQSSASAGCATAKLLIERHALTSAYQTTKGELK